MQLVYPDGSIVTRSYTARNLLQQVDYDPDGAGPRPPPLHRNRLGLCGHEFSFSSWKALPYKARFATQAARTPRKPLRSGIWPFATESYVSLKVSLGARSKEAPRLDRGSLFVSQGERASVCAQAVCAREVRARAVGSRPGERQYCP